MQRQAMEADLFTNPAVVSNIPSAYRAERDRTLCEWMLQQVHIINCTR